MIRLHNNKSTLIVILFFSIIALSSCKMRAEQKSLTSQFELCDILISDNLIKEALSEMKKAEKQCYDSWSYIGLYKRYIKLGEDKAAEKVLQKALKNNNKNPELLAVYSQFLLRNNRFDEAVKYSDSLRGTKYASLYSESVLQQLRKNISNDNLGDSYYSDQKYYNIYLDAYKSTKNPIWVRNCAVFHLKEGLFDNAASLLPGFYTSLDDAYFWALVLYDDGKYYEAIHALEAAKEYLKDYENTSKNAQFNQIQLISLEADAYLGAYDFESAEKERNTLINSLEDINKLNASDEQLLSMLVVNSAIYAKDSGDDKKESELLSYAVNRWPNYVPGVLLYTDFAYKTNVVRQEDEEQLLLRKAGITSLEMERYDNRVKIPLSDALYRLDYALENEKHPELEIKKLDLKYKLDSSFTEKEKIADLWKVLEVNFEGQGRFEPLLVQYALSYLLQTKHYEDAFVLFQRVINSLYNFDDKEDFWTQFETKLSVIDVKFVEFGAWFANYKKLEAEAIRLYQYCIYESAGMISEGSLSKFATPQACMNLADIYFSTGKKSQALDLYGKAAGRESNKYLRSEIFYRIACIYEAEGDLKNALRSADYSVSLYPDNARASLLKNKLK